MFYAIDYDTGTIESKSKTELPLLKYIAQNKLELAVALVSSGEELCLKLSLREIKRVIRSIGYSDKKLSKIDPTKSVFDLIETKQRHIPTFNKKLGQRLVKAAKKKCPDVRSKKNNSTKSETSKLSQTQKTVKQSPKRTARKETSKLKSIFGKI